ncbi:cobaltochelatase subunit CobN [Robbsia sp. Bb-Pol-6]|uniref:Cobaltochelatase subunit CobN n=1 Tax=Robbsia betulipollinis TaxID=2981849 RepID=A0ABT3ZGW4_9BURK|nr:cobaltochelatase subunit CobN [Robbsia betulipollinis]MCY0385707.1 cobaltochelatase subunit CobN [Robbsia betulipollinis]
MHLLRTTPGGFVDDSEGVVRIDQTPARIVVLSSADTTLSLLAAAQARLGPAWPTLRLANLAFLRQPASVDFYEEDVLRHAEVVVVDHLGGEAYWPYGIERVTDLAARRGQLLVMFSGDLQDDPALTAKSTADPALCHQLWRYLREGGPRNADAFLRCLAYRGLGWGHEPGLPEVLPPLSILPPPAHAAALAPCGDGEEGGCGKACNGKACNGKACNGKACNGKACNGQGCNGAGCRHLSVAPWVARWRPGVPTVAILFYRAHLQSGNTDVFDAIAAALERVGLNPLPVAVTSLKDPASVAGVRWLCERQRVSLVLNTTAFAAAAIARDGRADPLGPPPDRSADASWDASSGRRPGLADADALAGDAPVLQLILSGANRDDWMRDEQGLRARDVAMHIALPEVDGRIITRAVSFKGLAYHCPLTQVDVVRYQADHERIAFVAELSQRWCRLRTLPNARKRLALVMANYPLGEGRIGNGVGLDTPASVAGILAMLAAQGYRVDAPPADGAALMAYLTRGVTNDPTTRDARPAFQSLSMADYRQALVALPDAVRAALATQWGEPEDDPTVRDGRFMIAGWRFGRVFVGIQPSRSRGAGDYASYHDAQLVPPHAYLAFYLWLRQTFAVDAVVHVGKHGNLEWLPGKSVALGASCWPDLTLGPMPHLYPFIVNDPGEGSQAKRRAQAVIIDHLMPPLTRAESYGPLQDLERQVDEYYDALLVDPRRARLLRRTILATIVAHRLHQELGLAPPTDPDAEDALLNRADAYLCELKEAQIRDGLHTFGVSPAGVQRRDTLLALSRFPVGDGKGVRAGLLAALAQDLALGDDFDAVQGDPARTWQGARPALLMGCTDAPWRHHGDTRERLELLALALLERMGGLEDGGGIPGDAMGRGDAAHPLDRALATMPLTGRVLARIASQLAPRLDACGPQEMHQLARGLAGCFVPPGPSGAPSRGRPDVLPTGRNFYSVDTRAIPTQSAWALGLKSANQLVERHLQEHGDFPRAIGLSVWGTATMRTGGDDIAQAFALIGVRPRWAAGSHRVSDFEILPIAIFNRPRIDVTLRVSGFFRDAFANVMHLFDAAVQAVAELDEPEDENPIRARVMRERDAWVARGVAPEVARERAGWRVFGSRPGSYGAGLQSVIEGGHWQDDADLSDAYQAAGGYAYSLTHDGAEAGAVFGERLTALDVVLQNQDNREHDVLDSSDYHQFQGGMTAAVRHLSGQQPVVYLGDHSQADAPRIRTLGEEISRVIRSRAVNPKWLDGVKRHGYKGAAELADTVDCLFGYDATARVVSDHQYALVTDAYLNDPATRAFLARDNPQALHAICERLLEAMQRGLWEHPGAYHDQVRAHLLDAEQRLEQLS